MSRRVASFGGRSIARNFSGRRRRHFLHLRTVTPATQRRYRAAIDAFERWARRNGESAVDAESLDDVLVEYVHDLYLSGRGRSAATCALHGIAWRNPAFRAQLPLAAASLRGWQRSVVPRSYPPMTWELALVVGARLVADGHRRVGVGVLLAFDCLLRAGELAGLRREDVLDDGDARVGSEHRGVLLRLRHTKTGANKSVEVLEPVVVEQLRALVADTAPGARLFPFTVAVFRRRFKRVCAALGLSPRYVPHSLRHGGATRYSHVKGWPVEDVMVRGRWASTKSARIYLQAGVALQMAMDIPADVARVGAALAADACACLRAAVARGSALSRTSTESR